MLLFVTYSIYGEDDALEGMCHYSFACVLVTMPSAKGQQDCCFPALREMLFYLYIKVA